jgi:MOSC domain-containing protein YiiM
MPGTILAICTSKHKGIPKYAQPVATVGTWGLEGDYHNKPTRWSYKRAIAVPNVDRHILLLDQETKEAIAARAGDVFRGKVRLLKHGSLSENLLVQGLGDLLELAGKRLHIRGGEVVLKVIEPAEPCKHVRAAYGLEVYTVLMSQRGMYCAIESGKGRHIFPGNPIEVC